MRLKAAAEPISVCFVIDQATQVNVIPLREIPQYLQRADLFALDRWVWQAVAE